MTAALRADTAGHVLDAFALANDKGLLSDQRYGQIMSGLRIEWKGSFTARMGDALYRPRKGIIRLRFSTLLMPLDTAAGRRDTAYHEAAHIVVDATYREKYQGFARRQRNCEPARPPERPSAHGWQWKRVMTHLGYPNPARCHNVTAPTPQTPLEARCGCKTWWLTKRRRHALEAGGLVCRGCKGKLAAV